MNNAEMKIVYFDERDVIATSGKTITIANSLNNVLNDNTYTFGGTTYDRNDFANLENLVDNYFGSGAYTTSLAGNNTTISLLVKKDTGKDSKTNYEDRNQGGTSNKYNTTFLWNGSGWQMKQ